MNRSYILLSPLILGVLAALAGDPRTNNQNPEPGPGTNAVARPKHNFPYHQQQLQSLVADTNRPGPYTAPVAPPPAPKLIGIVLYDVYAVQASPTTPPLLAVDPRYLHDLTNHYRFQYIPVLRLEEP